MIKTRKGSTQVHRSASHLRQEARKVGLEIPEPMYSLPDTELEETDVA